MGINKTLIIGFIVVTLVAIGYFVFVRGEAGPLLERSGENQTGASAQADRELILLLDALGSIDLDGSLFGDPAYRSLQDFRVEPPQEPVGRSNPFAPLGN